MRGACTPSSQSGWPRARRERADRQGRPERGAHRATTWLCAAIVERVLEKPEDEAEHCVADRRLAEGSAVGGELRQLLTRRVVPVEQHGQGPCRDMLDEARQQATEDRRP